MVGVTWENQRKADITAGDLQGDIIVVAQASVIFKVPIGFIEAENWL